MVDYWQTHACGSAWLLVVVDISEKKGDVMDTQPTPGSARRGTPGLDIFKIADQSISGFLSSFKTGSTSQIRQPETSSDLLKVEVASAKEVQTASPEAIPARPVSLRPYKRSYTRERAPDKRSDTERG